MQGAISSSSFLSLLLVPSIFSCSVACSVLTSTGKGSRTGISARIACGKFSVYHNRNNPCPCVTSLLTPPLLLLLVQRTRFWIPRAYSSYVSSLEMVMILICSFLSPPILFILLTMLMRSCRVLLCGGRLLFMSGGCLKSSVALSLFSCSRSVLVHGNCWKFSSCRASKPSLPLIQKRLVLLLRKILKVILVAIHVK